MKSRFFLNVVVRQRTAIFELFTGENQTLLIERDPFLVLDFGLHVLDGVRRLDLKGDGFAGQGFDKDLHSASQAQDKVKGGLLLNIVVRQGAAIFELFSGENQTLLIRRDSFLVLDLGLHVLDGVGRLDLKGDGFTGQGFDKDLHSASQSQDKVKGGLLLNVVVRQGAAIFELFSGENQTLLIRRDSFL